MKIYNHVLTWEKDQIRYIELNRPQKLNAINGETIEELIHFFQEIKATSVKLVVLSGTGPNFCSGMDLNWMKNADSEELDKNSDLIIKLYLAISHCEVPVIAKVSGKVFAGGLGIAAACDIVIADKNSLFSIPEVRMGMVPAIMAPFIIDRIGTARFRELSITTRVINADLALNYGLVDFLEESEKINELLNQIIQNISMGKNHAIKMTKNICQKCFQSNRENLLKVLAEDLSKARKHPLTTLAINEFFNN